MGSREIVQIIPANGWSAIYAIRPAQNKMILYGDLRSPVGP